MCIPAGQDEFFLIIGIPVESRTVPAPLPDKAEQEATGKLVKTLLVKYRTEMVTP